jgi:hypothetical protein
MMDGMLTDPGNPADGEASPVPLLVALLAAFHRRDISYCYWKSSRRLHRALAGDSDLDLLIARDDRQVAQETLLQCAFKAFPCVAHRDHPAIVSFVGHDEHTGRIVHVHVHFRLVVGEALLKHYRLPWEDALLARAVLHPQAAIRVVDPASEALLMVVRSCFELRRTDPVALRHWSAVQEKFERDREALARQVTADMFRRRAREVFDDDLAELATEAAFSDRALVGQRRLHRRVRQALAERRAYNAVEGRVRSLARTALWVAGGVNDRLLHAPRPWSRRAGGGGCVIAVLGVDGSGKSTAVRSLKDWLGSEVDVMPVYFGTGDGRPSLLFLPFKLLSGLIARVIRTKPRGSSHGRISDREPGLLFSMLLMGWAVVVAMDKRRKLLAAHRGADRGLVVVADRYPQNEDPTYSDGPLLHRVRTAPRWLRRFEARSYELATRLPPDLVIKLEVTAGTLARREPEMNADVIRQRIVGFRRLSFPGTRVVSVPAEQPLADLLRAIKREVWRVL